MGRVMDWLWWMLIGSIGACWGAVGWNISAGIANRRSANTFKALIQSQPERQAEIMRKLEAIYVRTKDDAS